MNTPSGSHHLVENNKPWCNENEKCRYTREKVKEIPERDILARWLLGFSKYGDPKGPRVLIWLLIFPRIWI